MAVEPLSGWAKRLSEMNQSTSPPAGAKELADFYGDMADKVEGVGGKPGIFTFNRAVFIAALDGFPPDPSAPSWALRVSDAWQKACAASIITPATVTNAAWTASVKDVLTVPIGAATIITLSAAKVKLQTDLIASATVFKGNSDQGIIKFASAFREATLLFQFLTIGLVLAPPGAPVPLPIPTAAK